MVSASAWPVSRGPRVPKVSVKVSELGLANAGAGLPPLKREKTTIKKDREISRSILQIVQKQELAARAIQTRLARQISLCLFGSRGAEARARARNPEAEPYGPLQDKDRCQTIKRKKMRVPGEGIGSSVRRPTRPRRPFCFRALPKWPGPACGPGIRNPLRQRHLLAPAHRPRSTDRRVQGRGKKPLQPVFVPTRDANKHTPRPPKRPSTRSPAETKS